MPGPDGYYEILSEIDQGYGLLALSGLLVLAALVYVRRLFPDLGTRLSAITVRLPRWPGLPLVLALALVVRLPGLSQSFWYDETWTGTISRMSFELLSPVILADVHPPFAYIPFWLTARLFGSSDLALRLPSLLAGLLAVWLMYRLARAILDEPTARAAAVIFALMPGAVWYSDEARAYSLLVAAVLAALVAVLEQRPRLFIVSALWLPLLHAHGYLYLFMIAIMALWLCGRHWLPMIALAGLPGAVWLPGVLLQSGDVSNGFWLSPLTLPGAFKAAHDMTLGLRVPAPVALLSIPLAAMLIGIAIWASRRWLISRRGAALVAVAVGVPVIAAAVSWLWHPVYLPRALLPAFSLLIVPVAWAVTHSDVRRPLVAVGLPVLLISLGGSLIISPRFDMRAYFDGCTGADYVYATSSAMAVSALYYAPAPVYVMPDANDLNQFISTDGKQAFGMVERHIDDLSGIVCVVRQENPLTAAIERRYVSLAVASAAQVEHEQLYDHRLFEIERYRLTYDH